MTLSTRCKICGETAVETFRIPSSKLTGQPIPEMPDDCAYYECTWCRFCFTDILDTADHAGVYDESYWNNQDPDWHGRVNETLRLVLLANTLLVRDPARIEILDFGCGMGTFIQTARDKLGMQVWGSDIIEPRFGREFFLGKLPEKKFDIIVCCEVLEHLPFPREILRDLFRSLKPGGIFAFQTAYYDPAVCKRDWWYIGPANGHVSLYSVGAFDVLFSALGGKRRILWNDYPGVQAWQIGPSPADTASLSAASTTLPLSKVCDAADFFTPEYIDVANNELHEAPYLHRKQWEFAMIFLALKKMGMLDLARTGLSMGSGNERVLYAVSRHVKHLTVTDLYNAETLWQCAKTSDPGEYIRKSKPFPVDESRISALNMDMRELIFDDSSFDFAYSSCAFEHIGEDADFLRHLNEVYRVLKDGGIYVMTTEFTYENNTIPIKNNFLFSADHLCRLIGESSFTPEKRFDARIAEQNANFPIPAALDDLFPADMSDFMRTIASSGAVPHVQLLRDGHPFTSCLFVLQKEVGRRNKSDIVVVGLAESRRFLQARMERYGMELAAPLFVSLRLRAVEAAPRWVKRLYRTIKGIASS